MTQFVIHQNLDSYSRVAIPYLIDVQSRWLSQLQTCVVIPLMALSRYDPTPIQRLNPVINIDGIGFVLVTQAMAPMPKSKLGAEILDLRKNPELIVSAVDFLMSGY